jgi:hypothetical protein
VLPWWSTEPTFAGVGGRLRPARGRAAARRDLDRDLVGDYRRRRALPRPLGPKSRHAGLVAIDVFGVSMPPPRIHCDLAGILPFIGSGTVVAISSSSATIRSPPGMVWLRRSHAGAVAVWELG